MPAAEQDGWCLRIVGYVLRYVGRWDGEPKPACQPACQPARLIMYNVLQAYLEP
jgi:hypothetical protein